MSAAAVALVDLVDGQPGLDVLLRLALEDPLATVRARLELLAVVLDSRWQIVVGSPGSVKPIGIWQTWQSCGRPRTKCRPPASMLRFSLSQSGL